MRPTRALKTPGMAMVSFCQAARSRAPGDKGGVIGSVSPRLAASGSDAGLQLPREQLVEIIPARLALDAEPPGVEGPAVQAALHLLADADVLPLHLLRHRDTPLDVLPGRVP